MTSTKNEDLKNLLDGIVDPVILVDQHESQRLRFFINVPTMDPGLAMPELWGSVVADIVGALAAVYASLKGGKERQYIDVIMRTLLDDMAKRNKDPSHAAAVAMRIVGKPSKLH